MHIAGGIKLRVSTCVVYVTVGIYHVQRKIGNGSYVFCEISKAVSCIKEKGVMLSNYEKFRRSLACNTVNTGKNLLALKKLLRILLLF